MYISIVFLHSQSGNVINKKANNFLSDEIKLTDTLFIDFLLLRKYWHGLLLFVPFTS